MDDEPLRRHAALASCLESREFIEREISFPIEYETLLDQIGDRSIEAPLGESESIGDVLDRGGHASYRSSEEVQAALIGNLDDAYVGRKYYDDRGANYHTVEILSF